MAVLNVADPVCWVSISPNLARVLGVLGHWSVSAGEPRGELVPLLPAQASTRADDGWQIYQCTVTQGAAVLAWAEALRNGVRGQMSHCDAAALGQWIRHVRTAVWRHQDASAQGIAPPPPPVRIVARAALPKFTAENYASHCMSSLRELVTFAQGEAWAEGAGPWQGAEPTDEGAAA